MAKHPVPKQKTSKSVTHKRYASFKNAFLKKTKTSIRLENCPNCKEKKLLHHACPNCGKYKGKTIIDNRKQIDKITKVKA